MTLKYFKSGRTRRKITTVYNLNIFHHLLGITKLDRERNQSVREEHGGLEIKQYQRQQLQHVDRTVTDRIPKQALKYRPTRNRSIARPTKIWKEQLNLEG
jgi:hypothetical protein